MICNVCNVIIYVMSLSTVNSIAIGCSKNLSFIDKQLTDTYFTKGMRSGLQRHVCPIFSWNDISAG